MAKALMMQDEDDERIEKLKLCLHISRKIDVVRAGLALLENEAERAQKVSQWKKAARLVAKNSDEINKEFQAHSGLKSDDRT